MSNSIYMDMINSMKLENHMRSIIDDIDKRLTALEGEQEVSNPANCEGITNPTARQRVADAFLHAALVNGIGSEDTYLEVARILRFGASLGEDSWKLPGMAAVLEAAVEEGGNSGKLPSKHGYITDGYQYWSVVCPRCGKKTMSVVRPGKVQCANCG